MLRRGAPRLKARLSTERLSIIRRDTTLAGAACAELVLMGPGGLAPFLRRPDWDRRDVIFPLELDRSRVSAGRDCITQLLDRCIGPVHLQIHPADVHPSVVDVTALAGLPVHNEFPVAGILDQHV